MIEDKKIVVVMPAYNAGDTLEKTVSELPKIVDEIIIIDDCSHDHTKDVAEALDVHYVRHNENKGYGGNQKTCYQEALKLGADYVIMVHPDYQYSPKLAHAMAAMLFSSHYDIVLASRVIGDQSTRRSGMPYWRYIPNRLLTFIQNILIGYKLSEYHSGYRAYTRHVLEILSFEDFSDDFIFDNQLLVQAISRGFRIGEISCPTRYENESSSINFYRSVVYGLGVLKTSVDLRLHKMGIIKSTLFRNNS